MSSVLRRDIETIRRALAARGYRSEVASIWRRGELRPGSALAIQFGEATAAGSNGHSRLFIDGIVQINADEQASQGLVHLVIEKADQVITDRSLELSLKIDLHLAIDANCRLPNELRLGVSAIQSGYAYRHLVGLLADANETIRSLPLGQQRRSGGSPAASIEARMVGDLAIGRTGLAQSSLQTFSQNYRDSVLSACNWLQQRALPELRLVMRDLAGTRYGSKRQPGRSPIANDPVVIPGFHEATNSVLEPQTAQ